MTLPGRIRGLLVHEGLRASAVNALWLSSDILIRFVSAFFIGLWVARYLGPESYGRLQYALSWVGLFNAFVWLGVGQNVVRDLVRRNTGEGELLGNTFALRMAGSALAIALTILLGGLMAGNHGSVISLIWILCLAIPFTASTAGISIWFEARMQLKTPMIAKNIVTLLGAGWRVVLIVSQAPLVAFAWVVAAEGVMLCGALFIAYKLARGCISRWRFSYHGALRIGRDGLPILFASLAAGLNLRIGQLMLGWLDSFHAVGIYAAATRFSEIWWFVPAILMSSLGPRFVYAQDVHSRLRRNVAWISAGLMGIAVIPCAAVMLASETLIGSLLGRDYLQGAPVLAIHIWTAVFIYLDAAALHYLLATDRQSVLIWKSLGAVTINATLAAVLIPRFGAVGAAIATLAAQAWAGCVFYMIHSRVRDVSRIQAAALYELAWGWWHPRASTP